MASALHALIWYLAAGPLGSFITAVPAGTPFKLSTASCVGPAGSPRDRGNWFDAVDKVILAAEHIADVKQEEPDTNQRADPGLVRDAIGYGVVRMPENPLLFSERRTLLQTAGRDPFHDVLLEDEEHDNDRQQRQCRHGEHPAPVVDGLGIKEQLECQ